MKDPREFREESLVKARHMGYPINEQLPLIDLPKRIREREDVIARTLVLFCTVAHSYGLPAKSALSWIEREGLQNSVSHHELSFLNGANHGRVRTFQGNVETLWALTWILNLHPSLDFASVCSNDFILMFPNIKTGATSETFRKNASVRDIEEILSKADLAYCLHWGIVHASKIGENIRGAVAPYVITNRRKALDWMIGEETWDDISLDT